MREPDNTTRKGQANNMTHAEGSTIEETEFLRFLRKGGRSKSSAQRALAYVKEFEQFLCDNGVDGLDSAKAADLDRFVTWVESNPKKTAKGHLWGIRYYYQYAENEEMAHLAGMLREERIERKSTLLKDFQGVDQVFLEKLHSAGLKNTEQMLKSGQTPEDRESLAKMVGIPEEAILEIVKLSDLARIPGVKGVRARLYHDAGVDTLEKMAEWEPEALRLMLVGFVKRTRFEGIAPLPAEVEFTISQASKLPRVVEY